MEQQLIRVHLLEQVKMVVQVVEDQLDLLLEIMLQVEQEIHLLLLQLKVKMVVQQYITLQ